MFSNSERLTDSFDVIECSFFKINKMNNFKSNSIEFDLVSIREISSLIWFNFTICMDEKLFISIR